MTVALVLHRADGAPLSTSFRRAAFGKDDPFARNREIAWEGPEAMIAGRASFIGELEVASFPHIETIVVVEGELTLTAAGAAPLVLGPQSRCCHRIRYRAAHPGRIPRAILCSARPLATSRRSAALSRCAPTPTSSRPHSLPAEVLLGPAPQCRSDNVFTEDGAEYRAGTWDSTPYHRIVRPHRQNEFMHLLAGSVRFAAPDGSVLSMGTGDALFVPKGAPIGWESSDRVAKFYVIQAVQA